MKKIVKFFSVSILLLSFIMVGFVNFKNNQDNNLTIKDLSFASIANAEIGNDPYHQCCVQCPGGVKFYCAMVSWEGCFTMPCAGGYC